MGTNIDLTAEYLKGYFILLDYINRNIEKYFGRTATVEESTLPNSNPNKILALKYHIDDENSITLMINPDTDNKSQMRLIVFHNLNQILNNPVFRLGDNSKDIFKAELIELEKLILQSLIVIYDRIHSGPRHKMAA